MSPDIGQIKLNILKELNVISDDILDLPEYPTKIKVDLIIRDLYEIMRQLSEMSEK